MCANYSLMRAFSREKLHLDYYAMALHNVFKRRFERQGLEENIKIINVFFCLA